MPKTPESKTAKKGPVKKAHTPPTEIRLQVGARADYRLTHKTGIHSCKVYIKPEENAAYYVINRVEGKIPLDPTPLEG